MVTGCGEGLHLFTPVMEALRFLLRKERIFSGSPGTMLEASYGLCFVAWLALPLAYDELFFPPELSCQTFSPQDLVQDARTRSRTL